MSMMWPYLLQEKIDNGTFGKERYNLETLLDKAIKIVYSISNTDYNQIALLAYTNQYSSNLIVFADIIYSKKIRYNIVSLEGVIGRAYKSSSSIYISDVSENEYYINAIIQTRSELAVPIKLGERVIGLINTESSEKNHFSYELVYQMEQMADDLGFMLGNIGFKIDSYKSIPIIHYKI